MINRREGPRSQKSKSFSSGKQIQYGMGKSGKIGICKEMFQSTSATASLSILFETRKKRESASLQTLQSTFAGVASNWKGARLREPKRRASPGGCNLPPETASASLRLLSKRSIATRSWLHRFSSPSSFIFPIWLRGFVESSSPAADGPLCSFFSYFSSPLSFESCCTINNTHMHIRLSF